MAVRNRFVAVLLCALALGGCVSREQADQKLAKACFAGISALGAESGFTGTMTGSKFSPSPEGQGLRHVALTVERQDGWLEDNIIYECTFEESFGPFKGSFTASLHNLRMGDQIYGRFGDEIVGDAQVFITLTDAIRKALYE